MKIEVERITPTKASAMLAESNVGNRQMRATVVDRYARDMEAGRWVQTGDPIRFGGDGILIDGQHRLQAIVESGKAQKMVIIRNLKQGAQVAIDTGAMRSFADVLAFQGYTNKTHLAASTRFCALYERDDLARRQSLSAGELLDYLQNNERLFDHVRWADNKNHAFRTLRGTKVAFTAIRHFTSETLPGELDAFFEQVRLGENLESGMPAFALRRWLERDQIATKRSHITVTQAVTVKAWNAFITGFPVHALRWQRGGSTPEAFPRIIRSHMAGDEFQSLEVAMEMVA